MIVVGLIIVLLAWMLGLPTELYYLGVVLLVLGLIFLLLGGIGHPVGGRRYWF
jgi:hypothetical protein